MPASRLESVIAHPHAILVLDSTVLADGGGPRPGAVEFVVDAFARGITVAVLRTDESRGSLPDVLVNLADDVRPVGADPRALLDELVAHLDGAVSESVLLSADADLVAAATALGMAGDVVGAAGARFGSVAEVDLRAYAPLAPERTELEHGVVLLDGWSVSMDRHEPDQVVTVGSNLMTGNGALGYRGTAPEWDAAADVACVVAGTYDRADGTWTELVNAPNALRTRWWVDGEPIRVTHDEPLPDGYAQHRRLDLRLGRTARRIDAPGGIVLSDERVARLEDLGSVIQRQRLVAPVGTRLTVRVAVDGDVWDLHGPHLPVLDLDVPGAAVEDLVAVRGPTVQSGVEVAVVQAATLGGARILTTDLERTERAVERVWELEVTDPGGVVLDLVMSVATSRDHANPAEHARTAAVAARAAGYETLLGRHAAMWRELWDTCDVTLDGDLTALAALRFGTYHNLIATPRHDAGLPIGARGLSCQAYQGSAFWDQEVYSLPPMLFTRPADARGIIAYRVATLDGARRKAQRLGYRGAYFAWISGDTGDELCPDFFFRDVLTDRPIRNHFNDWQMHVSPDIALAVQRYVHVTGDHSILADGGAELVCEVARFLDSFVWHDHLANTFHCLRLLGPDEYHENVDDDAFTNRQARDALRYACAVWDALDGDTLARLRDECDFTDDERARWAHVAERLFQPAPDEETLVVEQFRGYHALEDVRPDEVATRLLDPHEYWGWPNGVAVHTQVLKQADVVMSAVVRPELAAADSPEREVVAANVAHYLPRTQHGSSLSHGAYALVLARLGRTEQARELFGRSATTDLLSRRNAAPGGTFIGGIRTAACAVGWQIVVLGFAGLDVTDDGITLAPQLPVPWERLRFPVVVRGVALRVEITPGRIAVTSTSAGAEPLAVTVDGVRAVVAGGAAERW